MTVSEIPTVTCKTSLIEKLTARRAGILASCDKCGGRGVVQGDGEEVPCPKCRLSDLTTHLIGDVTSRFDAVKESRAISPSEIESFILCQRRWGWERLDGIKTDRGSDAAELGKAVHAQLERWFKAGILPDQNTEAGRIAESGLHLWPAPALVTEIEIHIGCETEAGRYHGYQDIGYVEQDTGIVVVGDHKTTGNFTWAKTANRYGADGLYDPNNLPDNIQANIYARSAMERHGVERVKLRWGYLRTKGARKAYPVEVVVTVPEVEQVFEEIIDPVACEIHAAEASGKTGIDMAINAKSCDAFGGCPHASRCNLSPTQRLVSIMEQQTLKQKIEAKKAAAAAAGTGPVIPAAPAPHINPPESSLPPAPAVVPTAAGAPGPEAPVTNVVPASSFAAKMAAKAAAAAGGAAPATPEAPAAVAAAPPAATKPKAASAKAPADPLAAARAAKAAADLAYAEAEKTAAAEAEAARLAAIAEAVRVEAEAKAATEAAAIAAANPPPAAKATRKTAAAPAETVTATGISKRLMDVCAALEGASTEESRRVLAAVSSLLGVGA